MTSIPEDNRTLARYLAVVVGGSPRVRRYRDEAERSFVDIMTVCDRPEEGVTTCATVCLSDHSIDLEVSGAPLRVEILMAAASHYEYAPNILSTCAFNVINTQMTCNPGRVFPGVVEMYYPAFEMKHVLFMPPFLWELETQVFETKTVAWLLAVPISDAEYEVAKKKGVEALEDLFEMKQIDIFDLERPSVI